MGVHADLAVGPNVEGKIVVVAHGGIVDCQGVSIERRAIHGLDGQHDKGLDSARVGLIAHPEGRDLMHRYRLSAQHELARNRAGVGHAESGEGQRQNPELSERSCSHCGLLGEDDAERIRLLKCPAKVLPAPVGQGKSPASPPPGPASLPKCPAKASPAPANEPKFPASLPPAPVGQLKSPASLPPGPAARRKSSQCLSPGAARGSPALLQMALRSRRLTRTSPVLMSSAAVPRCSPWWVQPGRP